jgi:hypothetical protein
LWTVSSVHFGFEGSGFRMMMMSIFKGLAHE